MYDELVNSLRICGKIRSADDYCVAFHDGCCESEPVCMYELWVDWNTQANNRRKPAMITNQYGKWPYRGMPLPEPPKEE